MPLRTSALTSCCGAVEIAGFPVYGNLKEDDIPKAMARANNLNRAFQIVILTADQNKKYEEMLVKAGFKNVATANNYNYFGHKLYFYLWSNKRKSRLHPNGRVGTNESDWELVYE